MKGTQEPQLPVVMGMGGVCVIVCDKLVREKEEGKGGNDTS